MDRMFRKATFGGFNKEDVMQYIETMKTEFFDYKSQVEETIRELNEKLASLESAGISGSASSEEESLHTGDPAMSINEAAEHLKRVADEICEKMSRLIGTLPQQNTCKPEPKADETPVSPEDKVEQMLQQLFSNKPAASKQPQEVRRSFSIGDVLPAYLK